jgi:hypothetical protein
MLSVLGTNGAVVEVLTTRPSMAARGNEKTNSEGGFLCQIPKALKPLVAILVTWVMYYAELMAKATVRTNS